jgi:hypothetical protein
MRFRSIVSFCRLFLTVQIPLLHLSPVIRRSAGFPFLEIDLKLIPFSIFRLKYILKNLFFLISASVIARYLYFFYNFFLSSHGNSFFAFQFFFLYIQFIFQLFFPCLNSRYN